ncbi:MAG: HAMP domain-containing protein [Mariprofundaceae bacterium]|nr:HAMP domain-containing protein [Mariprofundaceae bacterium]
MSTAFRLLPLLLSLLLLAAVTQLWPSKDADLMGLTGLIGWFNVILLMVLAFFLFRYGLRLLRGKTNQHGASALRAKLVIALVGMLLIPAVLLQGSASYVVNRGLDNWFDVKVENLLGRAMKLAEGLYSRIDQELQHSLLELSNDSTLRAQLAILPLSSNELNTYMNEVVDHYNWESMQLFDRNERLIASIQRGELTPLKADDFTEQARIAMTLGKVTTEVLSKGSREQMVGYAPIIIHQNAIALIRVSVLMPEGLVEHARAVEEDNRSYHELARHRESWGQLFDHLMTLITVFIVLIAGIIALIFARTLTRPVEQLARALAQVSDGDLDVSISGAPQDELGSLVSSFNIMTQKLKSNTQAVADAQRELTQALAESQQGKHILENLLANLQAGVLLLNEEGHIHLSNLAFAQLLDIEPAILEKIEPDQTLSTVAMPAATARMQLIYHVLEELKSGSESSLQQQLEVPMGHQRRILLVRGVRLSIPEPSGFKGYLLVIDDLTDLAEAQRQQAWLEVARSVAHEIKNPLTPIKLAAERLQRRVQKNRIDPHIFEQCAQTIIRQTNRLLRLTSDFSTLASLPKPRCSHVVATVFIDELIDLYAAYPRVCVQQPTTSWDCFCDEDQVRQVLINLMDNALAATQANRDAVRMYMAHDDGMTLFHIEDDGTGIHHDNATVIFDSYFSTKAEGSGLGLSISSRIAKEHDGELVLLSAQQPTHFCLRIPNHSR